MNTTTSTETFPAVRACAIAMLAGRVLQVDGVSAGRGRVIDWRTVKSGETLQSHADAFDTAQLFVALVGAERALSLFDESVEPPPAPPTVPRVTAYMIDPNCGGRRRSFEATKFGFRVYVEPHENDAAQAAFTEQLAALAEQITTTVVES
jgi:hypothetical protein